MSLKKLLSPYTKTKSRIQERDEFIAKVLKLSKQYGHNQIFLTFSVPVDGYKDQWSWKAHADLELLSELLEEEVIPSLDIK